MSSSQGVAFVPHSGITVACKNNNIALLRQFLLQVGPVAAFSPIDGLMKEAQLHQLLLSELVDNQEHLSLPNPSCTIPEWWHIRTAAIAK
jgi:hypothetical protein